MATHYVTQQQHQASLQQQQQQQLAHEHMLYTSSGAINTCASVTQTVNADVGKSYMYKVFLQLLLVKIFVHKRASIYCIHSYREVCGFLYLIVILLHYVCLNLSSGYSPKMDETGLNPMTSLSMSSSGLSMGSPVGAGGGGGGGGGSLALHSPPQQQQQQQRASNTSSPVHAPPSSLSVTPLLTTISQQQAEQHSQHQQQQQQQAEGQESGSGGAGAMPPGADASALLNQMNQLGPSDRCTPTQAQAMGQQLLAIIAYHERNKVTLPGIYLPSIFLPHPPLCPCV